MPNATKEKELPMPIEEKIAVLLREGELLEIEDILSKQKKWNSNLLILNTLIQVFHKEVEHNIQPAVFDYSLELDELAKHFVRLKLLIRRLEFDLPLEYQNELYDYCTQTGVSVFLILSILQNNIFFKEKTCKQIARVFEDAEGEHSPYALFFRAISMNLKEDTNESA